jgi:hypothetical protein
LLVHEKEIASRPAREWFKETTKKKDARRERQETSAISAAAPLWRLLPYA